MEYETEKTILFYYQKSDNTEHKLILPVTNISYMRNKDVFCIWLDTKLSDLGTNLKRFNLDVTNDPKTDIKYSLTNLGYYSIRFNSYDCEVFHINDKTLFRFKSKNMNIFYNLPLYLDVIDKFYLNSELFFVRLEFDKVNYKIDSFIWEEEKLINFSMDLLKIEDNYKFKSENKFALDKTLNNFKLI